MDKQTNGPVAKWPDRQIDKQTNKEIDKRTNRQQIDKKTDNQEFFPIGAAGQKECERV